MVIERKVKVILIKLVFFFLFFAFGRIFRKRKTRDYIIIITYGNRTSVVLSRPLQTANAKFRCSKRTKVTQIRRVLTLETVTDGEFDTTGRRRISSLKKKISTVY